MVELTQEVLKQHLRYDATTGEFWCLSGRNKGKRAGSINPLGRLTVSVLGKNRWAHRMAWLYTHNELPVAIDHINGNPLDNRLINLRSTTTRGNAMNMRFSDKNTSGATGVTKKSAGSWVVRVSSKHFGTYNSFEAAAARAKEVYAMLGYLPGHGETKEQRLQRV